MRDAEAAGQVGDVLTGTITDDRGGSGCHFLTVFDDANFQAGPKLARETMTALDELTRILNLGSVYDFQK